MKNRQYFEFLAKLVDKEPGYDILLETLYDMCFCSFVPNDDNRRIDGEYLRDKYMEEGLQQGSSSLPRTTDIGTCNMLEMLIGLSYRLEYELLGGIYEQPMQNWFWVLINNLRISYANVDLERWSAGILTIQDRVTTLLARTYLCDGNGGLFPLKVSHKDQRRVEIWYQMSQWIIENYPV